MCILILKEDGHLIAARDRLGRLPVLIGKDEDGYCVSFESSRSASWNTSPVKN